MPEQTQTLTLSISRDGADAGPLPVWKRLLDLFCILVSLPVTLPLGLAIAAYIKLTSPGPVLFRQERIGYRGQRFWCLKFRTMRVNADTTCHQEHLKSLLKSDAPMIKLDVKGDPRLIRGGAFLRATGLDELPQLINVLRGEMSLVGPAALSAVRIRTVRRLGPPTMRGSAGPDRPVAGQRQESHHFPPHDRAGHPVRTEQVPVAGSLDHGQDLLGLGGAGARNPRRCPHPGLVIPGKAGRSRRERSRQGRLKFSHLLPIPESWQSP